MLVLSRKERQTIRIGHEEIELTILEIHGRTVKIGINAPADVPVVRGELSASAPLKSMLCARVVHADLFAAIAQEVQEEVAAA